MAELIVIFRTGSDVEARIVRGLLEAHDIPMVVGMPASAFPMAVNSFGERNGFARAESPRHRPRSSCIDRVFAAKLYLEWFFPESIFSILSRRDLIAAFSDSMPCR